MSCAELTDKAACCATIDKDGDVCVPAVTAFSDGTVCAGWEHSIGGVSLKNAPADAAQIAACPPGDRAAPSARPREKLAPGVGCSALTDRVACCSASDGRTMAAYEDAPCGSPMGARTPGSHIPCATHPAPHTPRHTSSAARCAVTPTHLSAALQCPRRPPSRTARCARAHHTCTPSRSSGGARRSTLAATAARPTLGSRRWRRRIGELRRSVHGLGERQQLGRAGGRLHAGRGVHVCYGLSVQTSVSLVELWGQTIYPSRTAVSIQYPPLSPVATERS